MSTSRKLQNPMRGIQIFVNRNCSIKDDRGIVQEYFHEILNNDSVKKYSEQAIIIQEDFKAFAKYAKDKYPKNDEPQVN